MTLWQVDIHPAAGRPDIAARGIATEAAELGAGADMRVASCRGFLIQGELGRDAIQHITDSLLVDPIVERGVVARCGDETLNAAPEGCSLAVHVLYKPGVTDPVALTTTQAIAERGASVETRTFRKYWFSPLDDALLRRIANKILANDSIERVVVGPLIMDGFGVAQPYVFRKIEQPIQELDEDALMRLSRDGQLYLTPIEMKTVQQHFRDLGREPTDAELETIAQTWSEHCSHKTLAGRIAYRDEHGERPIREHAQRDDLRGHPGDPSSAGRRRLVRERFQGQRRRRPVR